DNHGELWSQKCRGQCGMATQPHNDLAWHFAGAKRQKQKRSKGKKNWPARRSRPIETLGLGVPNLRAEEPRARITDYVSVGIENRPTAPISARAADRVRRGIAPVGHIARRRRIGRISGVGDGSADNGSAEDSEADGAGAGRTAALRGGRRRHSG